MAVTQFGAPIPGNSLFTHAPGERPWERPSRLNTVEEATQFYITKLAREEILDDMMTALVAGIAINPIAEALTLSQVMRGTHTLDVAILVKPVIMEFLAAVADANEIDYKFTNKDAQAEIDQKERDRMQVVLIGALSKAQEEGTEDAGTELLGEISDFLAQDVVKLNGKFISNNGIPSLCGYTFKSIDSLKYKTFITQEMLKKGFLASNLFFSSICHTEKIISQYFEALNGIFMDIKECEEGRDIVKMLEGPVCHSGFKRLN